MMARNYDGNTSCALLLEYVVVCERHRGIGAILVGSLRPRFFLTRSPVPPLPHSRNWYVAAISARSRPDVGPSFWVRTRQWRRSPPDNRLQYRRTRRQRRARAGGTQSEI